MFNRGSYYALTVSADGANTGAYYSVTPTSNLTISQGGVTFAPSAPTQQMTSVSIYPETLQINAAPGYVNGGVTLITDAPSVDGRLLISPPVDVAVVVTLYGNGGAQLGQFIADPGTGGGVFSFPVDGNGIPAEELGEVLKKVVERK